MRPLELNTETIRCLLRNRRYQAVLVLLSTPTYLVGEFLVSGAGFAASSVWLLLLVMTYLSVLNERSHETQQLLETVAEPHDINRVFKYEPEARSHFQEQDWDGIDYGILVEYSAKKAEYVLDELLSNDVDIYLLLKRPDLAIDADDGGRQKRRIISTLEETLYDPGAEYWDAINLVFYTEQAAVRGRKLGDDHLYLGWYIYDRDAEGSTVWGHSNPILYVNERRAGFEALDNFFVAMTVDRLWRTGNTPVDLLDGQQPSWLSEFLTKGDSERKKQFLQAISPQVGLETELDITIESGDEPGYATYE